MQRPHRVFLSWFGTGFSPKAPGTVGSLAALPFAWAIVTLGGPWWLAVASLAVFVAGWAVIAVTPSATADPGWVVIDEVAGQWLTLVWIPADFFLYALGFFLFRAFDIFKPWPIRAIEKQIPGALGVMLDDIAAALFAGLLLYGIHMMLGA